MRHLLKTTAFASSLVAASFFVGTGVARAQAVPQDIEFSGEVSPACAFANPTAGTLVLDGTTTLTTAAAGGVSGTVELTCSGTFDFAVGAPVAVGAPATELTEAAGTFAAASFSAGIPTVEVDSSGTATVEGIDPVTDEEVTVDMTFVADTDIPANVNPYNFTVTLTATPQ